MKIFVVSICFLLILVSTTNAENINLKAPFAEAELLDSATETSLIVRLTLNVTEAADVEQATLDDFETLDCFAIDGTNRIKGELSVISGDKLHPVCKIAVGSANNQLRKDWNKFGLEVGYRFKKDGVFTARKPYGGISSITRCIKVSDVTATIGTASRTGADEISVPISLNADIRLNVELKKQNQNRTVIATPSGKANDTTVLFAKDDKTRIVKLKLIEDTPFNPTTIYKVSITQLSSQPSLTVNIEGDDAFSAGNFNPYTISVTEARVLDNGTASVTVLTSTSGSIKALINAQDALVINEQNNPGGTRTFVIAADKVSNGVNTLTFSGIATETGLPMTGKLTHSFDKDSVTFLKETPVTFTFDEATGELKIQFSLSRNIGTRWRFKESNGLGADVQLVNSEKKLYEASINLRNLSVPNKQLVDSKFEDIITDATFRKALVAIEIYSANNSNEIIASFQINFIKPKQEVIEKVERANRFIGENKLNDAKRLIAELLGFNPSSLNESQKDTIDGLIPQVKTAGNTQDRVLKILGFAGKIAAGIFGIPLPF